MSRYASTRSSLRPLFVEGGDAVTFVPVRDERARAEAVRIFDVQYRFIEGKATEAELEQIAGMKVAGKTVEADPRRLERIADAGQADLMEAYRELLG